MMGERKSRLCPNAVEMDEENRETALNARGKEDAQARILLVPSHHHRKPLHD